MTAGRGLVLDANILIRAVLGRRVRSLLETYQESIAFYTPDICFRDAREAVAVPIQRLFDPLDVELAHGATIHSITTTPVSRPLLLKKRSGGDVFKGRFRPVCAHDASHGRANVSIVMRQVDMNSIRSDAYAADPVDLHELVSDAPLDTFQIDFAGHVPRLQA
jgi:hypothetical protein